MGLLSNPKTRQKLMNVILRYNNKLCFVCYVVGLCWFLALAYTPFNAKTYFSENALLPGKKNLSYVTCKSITFRSHQTWLTPVEIA